MPFNLMPLDEADAPRCVEIYFNAFQNAHSLACWPRTAGIRAWWEIMIRDELHEPHSHWLKAVDQATGQVAGFCKWQAPRPGVVPDTHLPEWPSGADRRLCDETFGAWARWHAEFFGDRGHWYLEMLATDPLYQGKGAGSMMLAWGLERADAGEWEAYLEASPEAVPLYKKTGFRQAGYVDTLIENERVKETMYRNLFMIRPARSLSD